MELKSVLSNPSFFTYGMIGLTTIVLAALTVFDSADDNTDNDTSYVSQLFQNDNEQDQEKEQQQETSLLSALTGDQTQYGGSNNKTKRQNGKRFRKTHHKKNK